MEPSISSGRGADTSLAPDSDVGTTRRWETAGGSFPFQSPRDHPLVQTSEVGSSSRIRGIGAGEGGVWRDVLEEG